MATPKLITVHGSFALPGESGTEVPDSGKITFKSSVRVTNGTSDYIVGPFYYIVELDANGSFSFKLPSTDDPDWTPVDWAYLVKEELSKGVRTYYISVPFASPADTLNLADVTPVDEPDLSYTSTYKAKGDLILGTGANNFGRLPVGADGQTLVADAASPTGAKWLTGGGSGIPPTLIDSKGDLIAGQANDTPVRFGVGTNGQVLKANSAQSQGLEWSTLTKSDVGLSNVDNTSDSSKPVSTATQTALDGKAATAHTHAQSDVTNLTTTLAGKSDTGHAHAQSDVTNLTATLSGKSDVGHGHVQADVTGLTTALAGKSDTGHTHAQADVTGLTTALAGKSDTGHTHAQSDVTGLTTALAAKAPIAAPAFTGSATAEELTLSKRVVTSPDTITISGGNADTDASLGNHFKISATANFTLTNPTNPADTQKILWQITQDATGGRTITLGSAFAFGTDITSVVLSTAANKCDMLGAVYDSTSGKWRVILFIKGF